MLKPFVEACTMLYRELEAGGPAVGDSRFLADVARAERSSPMRVTAQAPGILVVDDDEHIRSLVSDILTGEGYLVLPAANGAEALAVLECARVSLALLDMRMPLLDGWGFAHALRERRNWLPMLVMSAADEVQQWARDIGAAGCVRKPFDLVDLLAQVDRLVAPY